MVGRGVVVAGVAGVDHVVLYGGGMASLYHLVAHLHIDRGSGMILK